MPAWADSLPKIALGLMLPGLNIFQGVRAMLCSDMLPSPITIAGTKQAAGRLIGKLSQSPPDSQPHVNTHPQ